MGSVQTRKLGNLSGFLVAVVFHKHNKNRPCDMPKYAKMSVASYGKGSSAEATPKQYTSNNRVVRSTQTLSVDRHTRERTKRVGNTKKQKRINILKAVAVVAFFVIAFGITGRQDADYAQRPTVCREWQGSTVCYKP